jgi:D-alanyl-D-alanine carboxypeptidase
MLILAKLEQSFVQAIKPVILVIFQRTHMVLIDLQKMFNVITSRNLRNAAFITLCFFANDATFARTPTINVKTIDAIEMLMAAEMREQNIPGAGLAIVSKGKVVFAKGFGSANLEHDIAVTADSAFMIGSVSKPILAISIMMLAEQGKLNIDDAISKHIADTPNTWRDVTLRHLLNHTSGIVRESPAFDGTKTQTEIELIRAAYALPLQFLPGDKFQYCNLCYFMLAEVIARTSGEPWPQFIANQIFIPSAMSSTRTASIAALIPRRVASYAWENGVYANAREYPALRPSGAFVSSLNDLAKLEIALYNNRLLKADNLAKMASASTLNNGRLAEISVGVGYGLGWMISTVEGQLCVSHDGALAGFRATFARYPASGLAIILLTNASSAKPEKTSSKIAKLIFAE